MKHTPPRHRSSSLRARCPYVIGLLFLASPTAAQQPPDDAEESPPVEAVPTPAPPEPERAVPRVPAQTHDAEVPPTHDDDVPPDETFGTAEFGSHVGYGTLFGAPSSLGLGFGSHVGVEVHHFFFALRWDTYFGRIHDWQSSSGDDSDMFLGNVFGYSIGSGVLFRPQLFIAAFIEESNVGPALTPGAALLLPIGFFRLGVEIDAPLVWNPADVLPGFSGMATFDIPLKFKVH